MCVCAAEIQTKREKKKKLEIKILPPFLPRQARKLVFHNNCNEEREDIYYSILKTKKKLFVVLTHRFSPYGGKRGV